MKSEQTRDILSGVLVDHSTDIFERWEGGKMAPKVTRCREGEAGKSGKGHTVTTSQLWWL